MMMHVCIAKCLPPYVYLTHLLPDIITMFVVVGTLISIFLAIFKCIYNRVNYIHHTVSCILTTY